MPKRTITPVSHSAQALSSKKASSSSLEKASSSSSGNASSSASNALSKGKGGFHIPVLDPQLEKAKKAASEALSKRWLEALASGSSLDMSSGSSLGSSSTKAKKPKKSPVLSKPPFKPHTRKRVVRSGTYYRPYSDSGQRDPFKRYEPVPWIYLKGYWLKEAGFPIGAKLVVLVEEGCITIRQEVE